MNSKIIEYFFPHSKIVWKENINRRGRSSLSKPKVKKLAGLMRKYFDAIMGLMDFFGRTLELTGYLEKEGFTPSKFLQDSELISEFVEKAPPEVLGKFVKVLLRAASLSSQYKNVKDMTADEKIKLGHALRELAKDFHDLLKSIEGEDDE